MSTHRIAVTGEDDVVFQWRATLDSAEDAQAQLPAAQAEYPDAQVAVQVLEVTELDENGQPLAHTWNEVV